MNTPKNFFVVSRQLLTSRLWLSEPFSRGQAWVDLIGLACHSKSSVRIRGILIEVNRGQLCYSQLTLASRWHWSRNKLIRWIKELETEQRVIQQTNTVTTLITVLNYNEYQLGDTTDEPEEGSTERQQKDNRRDTLKKIKNDKNEKKDIYTSIVDFFNSTTGTLVKCTQKKVAQLDKRLETFTIEEIQRAIKNRTLDPWQRGENDSRKVWCTDWDSLFRNDEKIEHWLNYATKEKTNVPEDALPGETSVQYYHRTHNFN